MLSYSHKKKSINFLLQTQFSIIFLNKKNGKK